jgi:TRAP-type mannitol/chloroaromatic compound transport system substrate-binding protein
MQPEPMEIMERLGTAPGVVAPEHIFDKVEDAIISATEHVRASRVPARAMAANETAASAT